MINYAYDNGHLTMIFQDGIIVSDNLIEQIFNAVGDHTENQIQHDNIGVIVNTANNVVFQWIARYGDVANG